MRYVEFKEKFKERMDNLLDDFITSKGETDVDLSTEIMRVTKSGDPYDGLIIKGLSGSPVIRLDVCRQFFEYHMTVGDDPVEKQLDRTVEIAFEKDYKPFLNNALRKIKSGDKRNLFDNIFPEFNFNDVNDYNKMLEQNRLFVKVSNAGKNGEVLANAPHKALSDELVMTYHIYIGTNANEVNRGVASAIVNNDLFSKWKDDFGLTFEQLDRDALTSAKKRFPLKVDAIENFLSSIAMEMATEGHSITPSPSNQTMYVVTGKMSGNFVPAGAASLFYPGAFEEISEIIDQDGFYCIPSSVHEFLVLGEDAVKTSGLNIKDLTEMIKDVNAECVSPSDYLSDTLYHYDGKTKTFEKSEEYEARTKDKEKTGEKL